MDMKYVFHVSLRQKQVNDIWNFLQFRCVDKSITIRLLLNTWTGNHYEYAHTTKRFTDMKFFLKLTGTSFQFAWKKILKDAFPFISQRSLQVYTKRGDVDQAVDDFYALHPTDVISVSYRKI